MTCPPHFFFRHILSRSSHQRRIDNLGILDFHSNTTSIMVSVMNLINTNMYYNNLSFDNLLAPSRLTSTCPDYKVQTPSQKGLVRC